MSVYRAALICALFIVGACTTSSQRLLPPQLNYYYDETVEGLNEPALWSDRAAGRHDGQIRLLLDSNFASGNRAIIRIDRTHVGRATGRLIVGQTMGENQWRIIEDQTFTVSPSQLSRLDDAITEARLWQTPTEFWESTDPETICLDGVGAILERTTVQGYRFSATNLQCDAPTGFIAVARVMVDITQEPALRHWVY